MSSRTGVDASHVRADVRDAGVVVRTELRARVRHVLGDPRQLVAILFLCGMFGVGLPLIVLGPTLDYGAALASDAVPVGTSGVVFTGVAGTALYLGGASGFTQNRLGSVGPLVRTSIPPTAVSLGRFASETLQAVATVTPTALVLLVIVGVGAGTPVAPVVLALAALPVFLASLVAGRVLGDALRYVNRWLQVSLWTKALLMLGATTAAYVGSQLLIHSRLDDSGGFDAVSIPAFLPGDPLQAYAGVALEPLGAAGRPFGLAVAIALVAAIPLCLAVALRVETALLRDESSGGAAEPGDSRGVPRPFTASTAARVAWRYLLRTRRDPRLLAHLGPLLFGALAMVASVFTDPRSIRFLGPAAAVVAGTALSGAAFCLNPLGDDRDQLPLLLTSARSAGVLLRGRALAGLVPGLVLAVGVGTPLALAFYDLPTAVGQTLLAPVLALAGAGTALGIGALVPKFDRREYMSVERAHPSMIAVMAFFFASIAVSAVGLLLVNWSVSGPAPWLALLAWAVYLGVLGLSGGGGYRYAVRKFDALGLDDV